MSKSRPTGLLQLNTLKSCRGNILRLRQNILKLTAIFVHLHCSRCKVKKFGDKTKQLLLSSVDVKMRGSTRPTSSPPHVFMAKYSRKSLIRTLVIRIANYPDRLGPSGKYFLSVTVLHHFMA